MRARRTRNLAIVTYITNNALKEISGKNSRTVWEITVAGGSPAVGPRNGNGSPESSSLTRHGGYMADNVPERNVTSVP
jgi:hypothetical protein